MREHGLGRVPSPQDDRDYSLAALVEQLEAGTVATKVWPSDRILDQGSESSCVGFAFAGWGICLPTASDYTDADGHAIYRECKAIDGNDYDGSTVRSGAKAMRKRKRIANYYFAADIREAANFVLRFGSIVLGIEWHDEMTRPDANGIICPIGPVVGGHCILWTGIVIMNGYLYAVLRNSWGEEWGDHGDCYMLMADLERKFASGGEALAATEVLTPAGSRSFMASVGGWFRRALRFFK